MWCLLYFGHVMCIVFWSCDVHCTFVMCFLHWSYDWCVVIWSSDVCHTLVMWCALYFSHVSCDVCCMLIIWCVLYFGHVMCVVLWSCDMCCTFVSSRNNGIAVSTPLQDQYRGDGIGKMTCALSSACDIISWRKGNRSCKFWSECKNNQRFWRCSSNLGLYGFCHLELRGFS